MAELDYDAIAKALGGTRRGKVTPQHGYFGAQAMAMEVAALRDGGLGDGATPLPEPTRTVDPTSELG